MTRESISFVIELQTFGIVYLIIVTAPSLNSFKNRLDKYWLQQGIKYNCESEIFGTGSRSYIHVC